MVSPDADNGQQNLTLLIGEDLESLKKNSTMFFLIIMGCFVFCNNYHLSHKVLHEIYKLKLYIAQYFNQVSHSTTRPWLE